MQFPMDLSTLILWVDVIAIILMVTEQVLDAYEGGFSLLVDKKSMQNLTLLMGTLFLLSIFLQLYEMLI